MSVLNRAGNWLHSLGFVPYMFLVVVFSVVVGFGLWQGLSASGWVSCDFVGVPEYSVETREFTLVYGDMGNSLWSGCARQYTDGSMEVRVNSGAWFLFTSVSGVVRHEACHIRQFRDGRFASEFECFLEALE